MPVNRRLQIRNNVAARLLYTLLRENTSWKIFFPGLGSGMFSLRSRQGTRFKNAASVASGCEESSGIGPRYALRKTPAPPEESGVRAPIRMHGSGPRSLIVGGLSRWTVRRP